MPKKKAKNKIPEPYWNDLVGIFFSFCKEKYNDTPSFDNSQPRDLKAIIIGLRKRCESNSGEWTYEAATGRFRHFLEYCYQDSWLRDNFLLQNISRQKDKIFFKISKNK